MKSKKKDGFLKRNRLFDWLFMIILVLIYSIVSFINLGDIKAPQTFLKISPYDELVFEFPEQTFVSDATVYIGTCNNHFSFAYTYAKPGLDADKVLSESDFYNYQSTSFSGPFRWERLLFNKDTRAIALKNTSGRTVYFGEIAFHSTNNQKIENIKVSRISYETNGELGALSDEQDLIPEEISYMNSSYFDELYFAQTAYQYVTNQKGYETVHPPLGKILQSIPIKLTGNMSPFTWRMAGNIAGILIIIVTYFLALEIFSSKSYARLAAVLVSLCGLHFVQTRVGTIDSHLCLFTALSYLFMLKFIHTDKWRFFALSGLFFGCAFSVKWSGAFGGIGLAIIFFCHIYNAFIKKKLRKQTIFSVLLGVLCFILVPAIIYFGSYLLFPATTNAENLNDVVSQGENLYMFHSTLHDTHPYSSPWFSWPFSAKPMLYYLKNGGVIRLFGNYVICYASVIGMVLTFYFAIKKKDKLSRIISIAYLSMLIPYAFITRTMYLYHYLPASIFAIMAILNFFRLVPKTRKFILHFILAALLCFLVSYPAMTGI